MSTIRNHTYWNSLRLFSAALLASFSAFLGNIAAAEEPECVTCSPLAFGVSYTAEEWHNAAGGLREGSAFLDKLDLSVGLNGERLAGSWGPQLFLRGFFANGHGVSSTLVGDAQGISNIEALRVARIFELWSEWRTSEQTSMRLGLYDLNSEFDAIAPAQLFLNASQGIGRDVSQSGLMGPSIYPVTSLGARLRWAQPDGWSAQFVILDRVPGDPADPDATSIHLSRRDGALLSAELDWSAGPTDKVGVGAWRYTGDYAGLADQPTGTQSGNSGLYTLLSRQLLPADSVLHGGVAAFLRMGLADDRVNRFGSFAGGGLVYLPAETGQQIGLGVTSTRNGSTFLHLQRRNGNNLPVAETTLELTWLLPVRGWMTLQPDVQYVIHPNTDSSLRNDLALGVRIQIGWSSRDP